jgi:hypothetical protein
MGMDRDKDRGTDRVCVDDDDDDGDGVVAGWVSLERRFGCAKNMDMLLLLVQLLRLLAFVLSLLGAWCEQFC